MDTQGMWDWEHHELIKAIYPALCDHALEVFGEDAVDEAWDEFCIWDNDDFGFDATHQAASMFFVFFIYSWKLAFCDVVQNPQIPCDTTILHSFLQHPASKGLTPQERGILEKRARVQFFFFRVEEVYFGGRVRVWDIFLMKHIFIKSFLSLELSQIYYGAVTLNLFDHKELLWAELCENYNVLTSSSPICCELICRIRGASCILDLEDIQIEMRELYWALHPQYHTAVSLMVEDSAEIIVPHELCYYVNDSFSLYQDLKKRNWKGLLPWTWGPFRMAHSQISITVRSWHFLKEVDEWICKEFGYAKPRLCAVAIHPLGQGRLTILT